MRPWPRRRVKQKRRRKDKLAIIIDINRSLKKYLPRGAEAVKKAMRYSVLSAGKRIRPVIVIESARACGGDVGSAMPAACAVEFVHAFSLIHDDLPAMDDDDFRRGKPSCHKVFGEADAILAGDALLTLAFGTIADNVAGTRGIRIISELAKAIGPDGMALGQSLDMEFKNKNLDKRGLKKINMLKTAGLFEASAKIGAISAGAGRKKTEALAGFGRYFGLSFQATDDYMDGESGFGKESFYFMEKAKKHLSIFGKKADKLKAIADYAARRKR